MPSETSKHLDMILYTYAFVLHYLWHLLNGLYSSFLQHVFKIHNLNNICVFFFLCSHCNKVIVLSLGFSFRPERWKNWRLLCVESDFVFNFYFWPKAATETSVISQDTNFTDICQISSVVLKKGTNYQVKFKMKSNFKNKLRCLETNNRGKDFNIYIFNIYF